MTKSTITREQAQQIIDAADEVITALAGTNDEVHKDDTGKMVRLWDDLNDRYAPPEVVRELARMALSAMDSEPVAVVEPSDYVTAAQLVGEESLRKAVRELYEGALRVGDKLYRHAQPAPVVPNGLRLALSNAGIAAPESDEMLAATCEKHIQALVTWVKDRKPFQSAPVVPSFEEWLSAANRKPLGWVKDAMREAYDACRAAMLQAGNSPVIPDSSASMLRRWLVFGRGMQNAGSQLPHNLIAETEEMLAAAHCIIPMISDRWVPVSERVPTKQDGSVFLTWNGQYIGKELFLMGSFQCLKPEIITHWMPLPADPQEVKGE